MDVIEGSSSSSSTARGRGNAPSLTSHGTPNPRPLAASESVSSASEVVLWPSKTTAQPCDSAAAKSAWRIRRRVTSARAAGDGRRERRVDRRAGGEDLGDGVWAGCGSGSCDGRADQSIVRDERIVDRGRVWRVSSGKCAVKGSVSVLVDVLVDVGLDEDGDVAVAVAVDVSVPFKCAAGWTGSTAADVLVFFSCCCSVLPPSTSSSWL